MLKMRTAQLVLIALLLVAVALFLERRLGLDERADAEQNATVGLAVANAELYSARADVRLWRELENQDVDIDSVKQLLVNNLIGHVLTVRAANIDLRELKGISLETLCLLTTDEVKGILGQSDDEEMSTVALDFIQSIEPGVLEHVHKIQETMRGSGCTLSPGEPHF